MAIKREQSIESGRATVGRTLLICGGLLLLLAVIAVIAALLGSQRLPLSGSLCALAGGSNCGLSSEQQAILFDLRLPRILLAGAVGMCLASAGAGYQALLRNPLAEPYLLGVSNGAAVGTMTALVFFGAHEWSRPVMASAGALIATLVVYQLARGRAESPGNGFCRGSDRHAGGLSTRARTGRRHTGAFDLGVEVGRVRLTVFIAASLLVGASVASSGSVGYVGLVVPHLVRLSFGSDNRVVIAASALAGAAFVIVADTVARTIIAPRELPVGAITALIGAPLFIYLLKKG